MAKRKKKQRKPARHLIGKRPRGAVPLPEGGYLYDEHISTVMIGGKRRVLRIIPHHRDEPDAKAMAHVLIDLARAELKAKREREQRDDDQSEAA